MQATFDTATGTWRSGDLIVSTRLTDDLLAEAYLRLKREETLQTVYYEQVPTVCEFLERALQPSTICLGAFADRSERGLISKYRSKAVEFVGLSWVYDRVEMGNRMWKAEVGFAFFRHVATPAEKVALGKIMIQALFETFNIDILLGTTPIDNQSALGYAERVGFERVANLPDYLTWEGELSDAVVSRLKKSTWAERQRDEAFLGSVPEPCLNEHLEVA